MATRYWTNSGFMPSDRAWMGMYVKGTKMPNVIRNMPTISATKPNSLNGLAMSGLA